MTRVRPRHHTIPPGVVLEPGGALFEGIVETVMDAIIAIGADMRIRLFNRAAEQMFGCHAADVVGERIERFIPSPTRERHAGLVAAFGETAHNPRPMADREVGALRANGERFVAEARISRVFVDGESIFTVALRDVSARRAAELALAETQARYHALLNAMPANVVITGAGNEGVDYVNGHWRAYTGLGREESADWRRLGVVHPDDLPIVSRALTEGFASGKAFTSEFRLRGADGVYRWHMHWCEPVRDSRGEARHWIDVSLDIDERRRVETGLRRSEERLRLAQIAARMGTWEWDIARDTITGSEQMEWLLGLPPGGFGGTVEDFLARIHSGDRARVEHALAALVRDGHADIEYRVTHPRGDMRWISGRWQVFHDQDGTARAVGVGIDITERVAVEEELRRANATKDEFLGLVSHELKTPLTTVVGLASVLSRRIDELDSNTRREALDQLFRDAERLQALIENMLVLARLNRAATHLEPIRLEHSLAAAVALHRRRHPERTIEVAAEPDLPPVIAHPTWVGQLLENLLSNAEKYGAPAEPVRVTACGDGPHVTVHVLDRGPGIDPAEAERVFEPFYRSPGAPDAARGAGLGLAVCRRLAEVQGGTIGAAARPGGGADVWFTLPSVPPEPVI